MFSHTNVTSIYYYFKIAKFSLILSLQGNNQIIKQNIAMSNIL